jgi:hypothetical protein
VFAIAEVVASAFAKLIEVSNDPGRVIEVVDVLDEELHPLYCDSEGEAPTFEDLPKASEVLGFLRKFVESKTELQLCSEVLLLCLCYVDRLIRRTTAPFNGRTWRRTILGALIVAMKVWDELAVFNEDFQEFFFPLVPVTDLSALEWYILQQIDFDVTVSGSLYAKYYFEVLALRN